MFLLIFILLLIFGLVTTFYFVKIAIDSGRGGKWGVNFKPVFCPRCGEKMPNVRQPTSARQAMWGGWTCPKCGTELDKWGNEISIETGEPLTPKQLEESKIEPIAQPFDARGKTPVERLFEDDGK